MIQTFNDFRPGTLYNNPVQDRKLLVYPRFKKIIIDYPSRINAMAIDPSKISWEDNTKKYFSWEVVFSVCEYIRISIEVGNTLEFKWSRIPLIKQVLWFSENYKISVENNDEIKHIGLWTSSRLISWIITAMNYIYNNVLSEIEVIQLASQNHWEEKQNDLDELKHVQSIGWSASSWQFVWWLQIICWDWQVVFTQNIPPSYKLILWVPNAYLPKSAEELMNLEIEAMAWFIECWKKYGPEIAYNILHKLMPAARAGNRSLVWDVILDYRLNKGSIKNCSFCYDWIERLFRKLLPLKKQWIVDILYLSSVWPGIFAIYKSEQENKVLSAFKGADMKSKILKINNDTYEIIYEELVDDFWENESTINNFTEKPACKYVIWAIEQYLQNIRLPLNLINTVDIGFGWWRHIKYLLDKWLSVYGIDYNQKMVALVQSKYKWDFIQWTINNIPFQDNTFEILICTWVLHQNKIYEDYEKSISELSRVAKKDALLCINVFTSDFIDRDLIKIENTIWYVNQYNTVTWMITSDENIKLFAKYNLFIVDDNIIQEKTDVWYAKRAILRWIFRKS